MKEWRNILISPLTTIEETIQVIDRNSLQIAFIVDLNNKLLGTVTDGDIRRGILRGVTLDKDVREIMNTAPVTIPRMKSKEDILNIMKVNKLRHLPVVDNSDCMIGVERLEELIYPQQKENWVVFMAGGLGTRLRPLTNDCPKPMLPVGNKPVLETTLQQFIKQGFNKFYFSIYYKGEQIKNYFGNGSKWGIEIRYLEEEKTLGTIGSLSLFPETTDQPIIVMNGDILTNINMEQLISFHSEQQAQATICVRTYDVHIPYGVVKVSKHRLTGIEEKPVYTSFINAGIYVLKPQVLSRIPHNVTFDINQLLEMMLELKEEVAVFPIREYWIDIGSMNEYQQANADYQEVFE